MYYRTLDLAVLVVYFVAIINDGNGSDNRISQQQQNQKHHPQQQSDQLLKQSLDPLLTSNRTASIEQWITRRMKHAELRLNRKFDDRIRLLNQSSSKAELRKEMEVVSEEKIKMYDDDLQSLKNLVHHQQQDLKDVLESFWVLQNRVLNMEATVQRFSTGKWNGSRSGDRNAIQVVNNKWPTDCQDLYDRGAFASNEDLYFPFVQPKSSPRSFQVRCYINESGWTVIQRRFDGSVNFFRRWNDYKKGFGNIDGEFWLGNDYIYHLTNSGDYRLRIEMITWDGHRYWVEYDNFRLADEQDKYRLNISGYHGNAGDSLSSPWDNDHNGQQFSTRDNDNDNRFYDNCAEHYHGAWWFNSCFQSHLNGIYYMKGPHNDYFTRNGVLWNSIHQHASLKEVMMMIKPNVKVDGDDFQLQSKGIELI